MNDFYKVLTIVFACIFFALLLAFISTFDVGTVIKTKLKKLGVKRAKRAVKKYAPELVQEREVKDIVLEYLQENNLIVERR